MIKKLDIIYITAKHNSANFLFYQQIILKIIFQVYVSKDNNFFIYYHFLFNDNVKIIYIFIVHSY